MLCYDKIIVYERLDKRSSSKEFGICHCWYFLDERFKFELNVCNSCHDVLRMSVNFKDIVILNINDADYCCIINGIYYKVLTFLRKDKYYKKIKIQKSIITYKMCKGIIKFGNSEIDKHKFH